MCSTLEMRLAMLRAAIDEVAAAARAGQAGHTDPGELASRLAGLWAMIAELDPALAARLHGYGPDAGWDKPLCRHPGRTPNLPQVLARDHAEFGDHAVLSRGRGGRGLGPRADNAGHGESGRRPLSMVSGSTGVSSRRSQSRLWRSHRGAVVPAPGVPRWS